MIQLHDARVVFCPGTPDEKVALDGLNLSLAEGSFTVVVGANGAGKSTLLNVFAGSVVPRSGRLVIDRTDVTSWPVYRRAAMVSRVFQDPMLGTAPTLTVEQNLALADMRGKTRTLSMALDRKRRSRFAEQLAAFGLGLESRMTTPAGMLSGGQRQVLALIMATLDAPRLLLLDEHTAALDPRTAALVMDATRRVVSAQRLTTLMITHNMQHAVDHGDRLLMMEAGRIKLDVAGEEKAGLGVPEIVQRFGMAADHVLLQTVA
jgi:putative ABC transport system ATP-binding protein